MPSLRSRILMFLIKNRHLFRLQLTPKAVDWTQIQSILDLREEAERGARRFGRIPPTIEVSPTTIDGMHAEWILPSKVGKERTMLFFHGGGYVAGSCSDHRIHVSKFVKGTNVGALLHEYRIAPEHPFPAALDDSVKAYQWLLEQGVFPSSTVFVGDSAGGGLCLATLLALKDKGLPLPTAAVALSPWTDLKCTGNSYRANARTCISPEGTSTVFSKHYVGDHDPGHPWISPLYGDLRGFPPLFISVSDNEILYDDSVSFAQKAADAGVDVTLKVGEGMFHCYPVCAPLFPEATQAMDEICRFIRKHLYPEDRISDKAGHAV